MSVNKKARVDWVRDTTSPLINEPFRAGLAVLWRAYICAQYTGANVWNHSVRIGRLYEAGMTGSDLRWMVAKNFAANSLEMSGYQDANRSFRRGSGYSFNNDACLILTRSGAAFAEHVLRGTGRSPQATLSALAAVVNRSSALASSWQPAVTSTRANSEVKPCWDAVRRELSLAGLIVKRFRVPARNQETILCVFEEEGWAEHIQDPLPVTHDIDAPTRLHDAINRLNRCQINPLLRFHGDGKGTGVFWELSQPDM